MHFYHFLKLWSASKQLRRRLVRTTRSSNLSPLPKTQRCSQWSVVSNPRLYHVQPFAKIHVKLPTCQLMGLLKGNHMLPALHTLLLHIGRLSPGVWKPYLHAAVGIILHGGLEVAVKPTRWCNESSTHKKMAPSINWSSILLSNYSPAHAS